MNLFTCIIYRLFINLPRSHNQVFPFKRFFIFTITLKDISQLVKHLPSTAVQSSLLSVGNIFPIISYKANTISHQHISH